jgi:hypothetical protein
MSIFVFIFYLGIINIIFGFIWKWLFVLPSALLFTILHFDYGMRAVKLFGSYLLVSLTAILTLTALGDDPSTIVLIFYPLTGAFVLFMSYASNLYEAQKEARINFDWQMIQRLEKDSNFETLLMFGAVAFYVLVLFIPDIATSRFTEWLFSVINWVFNLPIIGWLIGIGGIIFLLSMTFQGIFSFGAISSLIVGKFRGAKES